MIEKLVDLAARSAGWATLREGVEILRLAGDATKGPSAALLRYREGARVPSHRHSGFEVIYVVSGAQSDERGTYPAGSLVINSAGDEHSVWSDSGCVVLILWERPIEFVDDIPESAI